MDLTIIAALSENNVIGIENTIPWHIKRDMQRFKELTLNHPVIMGRNTYQSIIYRINHPLPNRKNIVLSNTLPPKEGIYVAKNIEEALQLAENQDTYIIGGKAIYESFLSCANKMELTRVHKYFEGDTFFPPIKWSDWNLVNKITEDGKEFRYSFETYLRN